jgi:hypothetical protein
MRPWITSRIAAVSRTVCDTTCSHEKPLQRSPAPGPKDERARVGFSPTSPQWDAGMRIEPPPSLACAAATMPAATAAAAPPLDPPALWPSFHGFAVAPYASGSVVGSSASSGVLVRPSETKPAATSFSVKWLDTVSVQPARFRHFMPM